jgi:hypothetical protein
MPISVIYRRRYSYYRVTEIVFPCSALGAATVTRLLASFMIVYPAFVVDDVDGSFGIATIYLPAAVSTPRSTKLPLVQVAPVVRQILAAVVPIPVGKVPLLSSAY